MLVMVFSGLIVSSGLVGVNVCVSIEDGVL